jgi:hypothetical protein
LLRKMQIANPETIQKRAVRSANEGSGRLVGDPQVIQMGAERITAEKSIITENVNSIGDWSTAPSRHTKLRRSST